MISEKKHSVGGRIMPFESQHISADAGKGQFYWQIFTYLKQPTKVHSIKSSQFYYSSEVV